ncbi:DNA-binding transcriptional regulator, GntR family [Desulfocicer vacuolatum DSM 3385]|uniref:DNA-binding transcriptional regulator, GntR family n=1 Tax=Desulfocicer vacuolatum DSM 3385 TaxID=1121400 RepID=A0A1W2A6F6_9BACT|nr:GntR family transcriptional regulator [Desulfocicer vacuolatum]SMC56240.1 DNA-binding transcriptional regulator, GntR family [Desulfocicer vacuolatum DSM 3385]
MNQSIYTILKERILFLEYKPGEILNENVLAKEFGVSRTPMREILNRLEWEKLARVIARTGTMITEIEFQQMMNLYRARFEIEGLAGRLAAEGFTPEHGRKIEKLRAACGVLEKNNNREKDKKKLVLLDHEYRSILYDAVNNPVVTEVSQGLYEQTFRLWYITLASGDWQNEIASVIQEFGAVNDVLLSGNTQQAYDLRKSLLVDHFDRIKTKFLGI